MQRRMGVYSIQPNASGDLEGVLYLSEARLNQLVRLLRGQREMLRAIDADVQAVSMALTDFEMTLNALREEKVNNA